MVITNSDQIQMIITLFRIIGSSHTYIALIQFLMKSQIEKTLRSTTLTKVNFRFSSVKRKIEKDETNKYA